MTVSTEHIVTPVRPSVDTMSAFLRGKTEPIFARDTFMAGLRAHGRLTFGEDGVDMDWPVRFKRRAVTAANGYNQSIASPQTATRRRARLPWRSFRLSESFTKFEQLANRGKARLYDTIGNLAAECMDDFVYDFRRLLFHDGNASATATSLHGLESIFGVSGLIDAAAKCGNPNDTYGGLSTALNHFGGSWTPDTGDQWPTGHGTVDYCFFSPLVIDSTNTNWTATTKTFANTWQECFRFAIAYQDMLQSEKFNMILMNTAALLQAQQSMESKQKLEVTQVSKIVEAGIHTLNFDGLELASEPNVPTGVSYLFQWDKITLRNMLKQLVDFQQEYDPNERNTIMYLDCFCNLQFESPAFFAKVVPIS